MTALHEGQTSLRQSSALNHDQGSTSEGRRGTQHAQYAEIFQYHVARPPHAPLVSIVTGVKNIIGIDIRLIFATSSGNRLTGTI